MKLQPKLPTPRSLPPWPDVDVKLLASEIIDLKGKRFAMASVNDNKQVISLFEGLGYEHVTSRDPSDFDFAVFSGGSDICPLLYGEAKRSQTNYNLPRDLEEVAFAKSLPSTMPKIGICRGGQLLNVLSGGSMWQHVPEHAGVRHDVKLLFTEDSQVVESNSVHHQMMKPSDKAVLLGVAVGTKCNFKVGMTASELRASLGPKFIEPEIVYYPDTNSLCFQAHPEYDTMTAAYFLRTVEYVWPATKQTD